MNAAAGWSRLLRGVRSRGTSSLVLLAVATVTVAAAVSGPAYLTASQAAVLDASVREAPVVGQGIETGWHDQLSDLAAAAAIVEDARATSPASGLFPATVSGQEITWSTTEGQHSYLAWRDGVCGHVRLTAGHCPLAAGQAMVSEPAAEQEHWRVGDRITAGVTVTVTGIYTPVSPDERYWFNHSYFPQQTVQPLSQEFLDAVLTVPGTFSALPADVTGLSVVDLLLDLGAVTPARAPALRATVDQLRAAVATHGGAVTTGIPDVLDDSDASIRALQVPVLLITVQLLVPVWLLLFLAVGDATRARAHEVALSTLRGHSRLRTLGVALGEPLALLAAALPLGVLAGWSTTATLARVTLRPGTPVALTATAVAAAVAALSAGLLAAAIAAVRTTRRPVLEQWRSTARSGTRRGWIADVAVLVATAAAVAELYAAGAVGTASTHVLALAVPGLVGLGLAVAASRVLPWGCRRLFGPTARRGGLGLYLSVRQVARRPAGLRAVMMLATAFALVTFAVAAWTVVASNTAAVAATRVGAPSVLDVVPAPGEDLAATVVRLDPAGTRAVAVDAFSDFAASDRRTFAVDPGRFARVAFWRQDFTPARSPAAPALLATLHPAAPEPVTIEGDRLRIGIAGLTSDPVSLQLGLKLPTGHAVTPWLAGQVTAATRQLDVALPRCPCEVRGLSLLSSTGASGSFTVTSIEARAADGTWHAVPAQLDRAAQPPLWQPAGAEAGSSSVSTSGGSVAETPQPGPGGLQLTYRMPPSSLAEVSWTANSFPAPVPALVSQDVAGLPVGPGGSRTVAGLDGAPLLVLPVATVVVPGAPSGGVIVDRDYARRAAFDASATCTHQVWLADRLPDAFARSLQAAGVRVLAARTTADAEQTLRRQGPALASVLFVADAGTAALLAAAGAITGLHLSGRARRYELSALAAAGCPRRVLLRSLWIEQLTVLGTALGAGVAAGLVAVRMALPAVPEFVEPPAAPALLYSPSWPLLGGVLLGAALAVTAVSLLSGAALAASVRPDQLRQASA